MLTAFQIIAERRIEEFFQKDGGPDLSHWQGRPLPEEDLGHVPPDLRMAYRVLKNSGYVPEEVALHREIVRTEDLLARCRDEQVKLRQLRKLSLLKCRLEARLGRPLRLDADSSYFERVVERVVVHSPAGDPTP